MRLRTLLATTALAATALMGTAGVAAADEHACHPSGSSTSTLMGLLGIVAPPDVVSEPCTPIAEPGRQ